ncbi:MULTISPECIES: hypothetical protein [unclassified Pseudomonas]|uniref:hypothetical protein n=1 Tax=unclassified Pseudomonas TaxID=196821 RepID=UPI0021144262|nr:MULTISPECIES: hypothetical protein [unclassified Pseudomonas]
MNISSRNDKGGTSELKREDRYIVIKHSDIQGFWREDVREQFFAALERLNEHHVRIPQRKYLVIESDWPEYEPAWHMIERRVNGATGRHPEVVAVINEEGEHFKETVVEHRPGIDRLPVGTELVDRAHVNRLQAELDALQQRLLDAPESAPCANPQVEPDPVLCKFYDVTDWSGLVRELIGHVAQLQDSAKRNVKPWEDTFPPTLLPAYIERANASNTAAQREPVPCSHEWTDDGGYLLVCTACGVQEDHDPGWQDMDSAPRDGTMLRLLVEFEDHSTEDADQAPTIGANNFDNDGEDRWKFAGWCWSHDHFTEGKGIPVGWLPMLEVKATGIAEQPAPMPTPDDREELIGQLADEIGRLGMCSAADRELFERIIDANYRKQVAT